MTVAFFPPLPAAEVDYDALHRWLLTENISISRLTAGTLNASILFVGDIVLSDTGKITTAEDGNNRIALDATLGDRLVFESANYATATNRTAEANMQVSSPTADASSLWMFGATFSGDAAPRFNLYADGSSTYAQFDRIDTIYFGGVDDVTDIQYNGVSMVNWSDWSPTYTNLTIGNGTVVARYIQIGDTVHVTYSLTFGTTTSITGTPTISMPVTANSTTPNDTIIGSANLREVGTALRLGAVYKASTTTFGVYAQTASSSYVRLANLSSTVPFTWGDTDYIRFTATYEAA